VAAAEQVNQTVAGDGLRAQGGGAIQGGPLRLQEILQPSQSLFIITVSGGQGIRHEGLLFANSLSFLWRKPAMLEELLNQKVILDLRSTFVCIGTLTRLDDLHLELRDADLHDLRDTRSSRDNYVAAAKATGVKHNRKRLLVVRSEVVAVARLRDVIGE
jgi:hypothetical protein